MEDLKILSGGRFSICMLSVTVDRIYGKGNYIIGGGFNP